MENIDKILEKIEHLENKMQQYQFMEKVNSDNMTYIKESISSIKADIKSINHEMPLLLEFLKDYRNNSGCNPCERILKIEDNIKWIVRLFISTIILAIIYNVIPKG